jgi:hypothetical protein
MTLKLYHGIVSKTHERSERRALQRRKPSRFGIGCCRWGLFSRRANVLENLRHCRVDSVAVHRLFVYCHRPFISVLKRTWNMRVRIGLTQVLLLVPNAGDLPDICPDLVALSFVSSQRL